MSIHILSSAVSDQIAAGEVVERPASVVKECVENSIDAQASHIIVRIEEGGKTRIEIEDNGIGMVREDAVKSVLRHATSKITTIDDLFSVHTFGFRGEALAAIAAVSRLELKTRTENEKNATLLFVEGGKSHAPKDTACNHGTHLIIRDLFYTTPVRREYLKSTETEYRHILKEITYFALAYPHIGFELWKDNTCVLRVRETDTITQRIHDVLPHISNDIIPIKGESHDAFLSGFIIKPGKGARTKSHQYLFVNGRHVSDYRIATAVREGYMQSCGIEKHLHPVFILFLHTDPLLVDVNIHPRKREVKFSEPADIFQLTRRSVIEALKDTSSLHIHTPREQSQPQKGFSFGKKEMFLTSLPSFSQRHMQRSESIPSSDYALQDFVSEQTSEKTSYTHDTSSPSFLKAIGQIAHKYIVAESENGVFLFDQHALHERERFEKLWNTYQANSHTYQPLLTPQEIPFSREELSSIEEHRALFERMGFLFKTHEKTLSVSQVPSLFSSKDLTYVFQDVLKYIDNHEVSEDVLDQCMRKILEYKSCRGAIMYGDKIDIAEAQYLLDDFLKTQWATLCPHGRPNHIFFSFTSLDEQFHRL